MKKNVKRWLALILAVAMVSGTCLAHADGFLAATDGEDTQVTQESEPAVANEAGEEDKQAEQPKQEPVEEKQEIVIPKKEAAAEKAAEETAPETTAKKAEEVSIGQKVDVIPSEKKEDVYQVVFHRPAVEGGTLRVWTEGSNKKDVTYTQGKYVEEVTEGTTLYFEIESTGNYLVDSIKDQNGTEIAPTNVNGKISSYKMVINENKEFTITYKEAPEEEAEAEEETGLSKAPMARAAKVPTTHTVKVGETTTISGKKNEYKNCNYEQTWTTSDAKVATVDKNGTVTGIKKGEVNITHTYCEEEDEHNKHDEETETFTVTVTGSETDPQPEGTERVYVYMKMDPSKVPPGWQVNKDGWYTIGYVDVPGLPSAKNYSGLQSGLQPMVIEAINRGDLVRFSGHASLALDLSKMQWSGGFTGGTAGLKVADGAADYSGEAPAGTKTWHLDGWYNVQKTATVHIRGTQETKTYNGSEQNVTGYKITSNPDSVPADSIKLNDGKEAKASGTNVGKYPMGLKGTDFALPDDYDLVNFIVEDGWLEITPITDTRAITITGNKKTETYNGTTQTVTGYEVQYPEGLNEKDIQVALKDGVKAEASGTDAGTYSMGLTRDSFLVSSPNYSDIQVTVVDGSLTINKRDVTLTSATDSKTYDGTALTKDEVTVTAGSFVEGEGATYNVTGSQTLVGSSDNTFTYELIDGTKAGNYNITKVEGRLTVNDRPEDAKYAVTVTPNGDTVKYDGTAKSVSGFVNEEAGKIAVTAENGITYYVTGLTAGVTGTDAGEYTVDVEGAETAKVEDAAGHDVTDQFTVTVGEAALTISKRDVTLTSGTATKEYDGTALTNNEVTVGRDGFAEGEGATYTVTGSQTLAGSSENAFTYTLNEGTKAENYNITTSSGTLTVTNRDAKYSITVEAKSLTETYDGTEKSVKGFKTLEFEENGQKYTVSGLTAEAAGTNAGEYSVNVTGTAVVKDANGNDVTEQFAVKTENGKLKINKREVTLTSATDSKEYDGTALTNDEVKVTKGSFATGEGATYNVTGSQTLVGDSDNTFTYTLNEGTDEANYDIKKVEGTLTVTNRSEKYEITVEANSSTGNIYDGSEKSVSGFKTLTFEVNGQTYTVEGLNASAAGTDADTYTAEVKGTAVVKDAAGNDVTAQFDVKQKDGQLVIDKAVIGVKAVDTGKMLGQADPKLTYEVTKKGVNGEEAAFDGVLARTNGETVGNDYVINQGTLVLKDNGAFKTNNYELRFVSGRFEITDVSYTVAKTLTNRGTDDNGKFKAGETARFEIKVTNNGKYTVKDVVVLDTLTGGEGTLTVLPGHGYDVKGYSATIKEISAGSSVIVDVTYKVAQADIDHQNTIKNVATAISKGVTDLEKSEEVDVPVEGQSPEFKATKSLSNAGTGADGKFKVGETAKFDITVENTGNVTLNNVEVAEQLKGARIVAGNGYKVSPLNGTAIIDTLEVGGKVVVKAEYTITQEDVDNGGTRNAVTVEGKGPGTTDPNPKEPGTDIPTETPAPNLSVKKTMISTNAVYRVGDRIRYEIVVENKGNVTLHNVEVTDTLENAAGAVTFEGHDDVTFSGNTATIGTMAPGATVTLNCSYVVTRADAGNEIINSAVGDSDETNPTDPSRTDPANVENIYNLTINYVYAAGGTAAPSVRAQYLAGESFIYTSPSIAGYTPNYAFVRTGADGMPARDVVITIIYTANPVTPTTPTTPTPTTPGGGDGTAVTPAPAAAADGTPVGAEVALTEDGDVEVVPVVEEEVPLAKRDLDDHKCCVLHFLLMLAAMIVYAAYTRSMKKRQEKIAELAEELETEKLKREQQEAAE